MDLVLITIMNLFGQDHVTGTIFLCQYVVVFSPAVTKALVIAGFRVIFKG